MILLSRRNIIFILLLFFIAGVVTIFLTHNSYGGGDNFAHYKFAHWGWKYPELLFNHWGKPVFTILISPFAQFGINSARVFNLLMGFSTAIIIWDIAQILKIKNAAISTLFVLTTPVYFILMFTTLTEVSFSFFLALAVLLFFKKKYILSAIAVSILPLVRTEGIVLFPIFILAYAQKKQWFAIPLITLGFWLISFMGFPFYDDFWWLITKMPYSGNAKDIYGSGSLFHFIYNTKWILGYPLIGLFIIGLVIQLVVWLTIEKRQFTELYFFLLLIPGSFFIFLAAHSFVWWMGMGNSLGLIRVIGSVTPFAALTALIGFNYLVAQIKIKNKLIANIIGAVLLVWIVQVGISTNINGFRISKPKQLVGHAADFLQENKLDKHKIFYYNSYLIIKLGLDPFDESKSRVGVANRQQPAMSMPDSSILVWDAHFGPNEGRLPLYRLKNSNELTLLKVIRPTKSFKVLGGYDYAIYIFQKIPKKSEDSNIKQLSKEFVFGFDDLEDTNNSISYSGNNSLNVTPKQEYFTLIDYQISELKSSLSSFNIDFNAALFCENELYEKEFILVCTMETDGEDEVYQAVNLFDLIESNNKWSVVQHTFKIYDVPSTQGNLKLYLWNKSKATFNIDEVKIEVSTFDSQKE